MSSAWRSLGAAALLLVALEASALPIVSVDSDPATAGSGAVGSGVLASFGFEAVSRGTSGLDLSSLVLLGLPGELGSPPAEIHSGQATVAGPIPEPAAALLFGVACLVSGSAVRLRR